MATNQRRIASLETFRTVRTDAAARDARAMDDAADDGAARAGPVTAAEAERFQAILLPHLDAAYNLARHLARDPHLAEDIVHDAYVRALRAFPGFRDGDGRAWILRIVRNCFLDWARAQHRSAPLPLPGPSGDDDDEAAFDLPDPHQPTPEQIVSGAQQAQAVQQAILRLPAPFRAVLVLREMEEMSYREIAEVTETPIGTVMSRLARARTLFTRAWRQRATRGEGE